MIIKYLSMYIKIYKKKGSTEMIYDRIKELRENTGMSQSTLAKKLGVTRSSVNAWEMGISTPTTQYVVEMAKLFRVTTDYLLGVQNENLLSLDGMTKEETEILYKLAEYFDIKSEK